MSLNLLPSQAKFQMEKIRAKTLSKKILTVFLIVWIILVIIIFAITFGETQILNSKNTIYKTLVDDYLKSSKDIVISQTIKFRAKLLGTVLNDRFEYADAFNVVGKAFDPSIKIKNFELKDNTFFIMTVIASDADSMKLIESRVTEVNQGVEPKIKKINIKSATYSKSLAEWLVTVEVYLK